MTRLSRLIIEAIYPDEFDRRAHQAATSPQNGLPQPSDMQKEGGNYKKGHVTLYGLKLAIENPRGAERSGVDKSGKRWSVKLKHHYGYIKGTVGRDKDHLDVFIGPDLESDRVFVVNQVDEKGNFDEHKIMLGFPDEAAARAGYLSSYEDGWQGLGSIVQMSITGFKAWVASGKTTRPVR